MRLNRKSVYELTLKLFLFNEVFLDSSSPWSFSLLWTTHTAHSHILLCDFFNTVILHCIFVLSVNFHVCVFRFTNQISNIFQAGSVYYTFIYTPRVCVLYFYIYTQRCQQNMYIKCPIICWINKYSTLLYFIISLNTTLL